MFQKHKNGRFLKVAIGPVFDKYGGVSQHIFGIKKFSSHNVRVVPSKFARISFCKIRRTMDLYQRIMNKIHLNGYDVVHSHVDPWFTNLCLSSRINTCKWVHTYHTLYFEENFPEGLKTWQKEINRTLIEVASKADVKISISKWLHNYLYEKYLIQTEIIPNGVDLVACDNANPDRFVKKYGLHDFVLFVGNLQQVKNPQFFVKLAIQMPELRFVMIGRNLDAVNLMKEYGVSIPKNLTMIGEMRHKDTLDAISACKVFVVTSKREGISTSLLEAMCMSKNVVVPAHSGCKEVVHNKDYGFLYKPDSLDDLIEKTRKALVSKHIGKRARKRVLENYDWRVLAKKIDLIYESC